MEPSSLSSSSSLSLSSSSSSSSSRCVLRVHFLLGGAMRRMVVVVTLMLMATAGTVSGQDNFWYPPQISEPAFTRTEYLSNNSDKVLLCAASGSPPLIYLWRFEGSDVTATNPPGGRVSYNNQTGELTITKVAEEQTGSYRCLVTNSFTTPTGQNLTATDMSPRIQIKLSFVERWPASTTERSAEGREGAYLDIKCDKLPPHGGLVHLDWYIGTHTLIGEKIIPDERIFIDPSGTLHFSYLKNEDDDKDASGKKRFYSCGMSNANILVRGSRVGLEVGLASTEPNSVRLRYPVIPGRFLTVMKNSTARLECYYSGYVNGRVPSVSWKNNDNQVIQNKDRYTLQQNGRVLLIENVNEEDDFAYSCQNEPQDQSDPTTITLNVTSPPLWVRRLRSKTLPEGRNAVFHCQTRSLRGENSPEPPLWYQNGDFLQIPQEQREKVKLSHDNLTLTVVNVSKNTDNTCYQCVARNSVGEIFGKGCLNVILPITIIDTPEPKRIVRAGDVINLTVTATSEPKVPVSYEWTFKNVTYKGSSAPPRVFYDSNTLLAYLNTSGFNKDEMKSIAGRYRRRVYNKYENKTVDVFVELEPEAAPATAGFQYWIIGLILALLLILLVLIICCCVICRRKMQEGDYPVDKKENAAGLDPEKEIKEAEFQDLSRAEDPYQKKPGAGDMDGMSIKDDESFGSEDYDMEPTAFTEDGSFIGAYKSKNKDKAPMENPAFSSRENPRYGNVQPPPREIPQYNDVNAYPQREIPRYQNVPIPASQNYSSPRQQNGQPWENPTFKPDESSV